jgi:hypothetical protein
MEKLPWLHMDPKKPPMLSMLRDSSSILQGALRASRQAPATAAAETAMHLPA